MLTPVEEPPRGRAGAGVGVPPPAARDAGDAASSLSSSSIFATSAPSRAEEPRPPGTCKACLQHRGKCLGLALAVLADAVTASTLAGEGHGLHLILCVVRLTMLGVGFFLAVELGTGRLRCGRCLEAHRVSEGAHLANRREGADLRIPLATRDCLPPASASTSSSSAVAPGASFASSSPGLGESRAAAAERAARLDEEIARHRAALDMSEQNSGKKNVVLSLCFLAVTAQSTYTGIQVLVESNLHVVEAVCLTLAVFCMNVEFLLLKGLVTDLTEEEGVMLPGVHEHKLYYQKESHFAWCKMCRQRIGPMTGSQDGFKCKECAGDNPNSSFWVCIPCYRKQQSKANVAEGILRGDKGPKFIEELTTWQYFMRAVDLCRPFRFTLYLAVICVVVTQVARVLMPNYQGEIINALIDGESGRARFGRLLITYVSLSLVAMVFGSFQSLAVEIVQRRITVDMRTVMFVSLVKQDIAFFDGLMTGQVTSRMTNDVSAVVQPVRSLMNTVLTNILRLCGGLFMCLFTSWKLTVLASTMIGPVVYLTRIYAIWSKKINLRIRVNMADANAVATESLRNIRTVRSFGADDIEVAEFQKHMDEALRNGMKDAYAAAGVAAITQYLEFAATILILWYGGVAVLDAASGGKTDLTIGQLITFNLYWSMLNNAITGLNGVLNTLIRAASAAQRVFEIIDLEPDIDLSKGTYTISPGSPCTVAFREVRFSYQMRPDKEVLKGLSFDIPAGSTVAVVGRSGAGKSTLVSLLLRFYDPQGGEVLLNGVPLQEYDLRAFQKRVGVVSQETQVFCRPIRDNIMYGLRESEVTDEMVAEAARGANAHEFIEELDEGYRAMIGEGGVRLSGGQKQRLAIARALLRKPSLLLLDEATSALDAENEGKVQESLDQLVRTMAGRCSVMLIAHRLSTVMNADKIVVVDSGTVVEQGTHAELLENGHIYAQLVQRQIARQANTIPEDSPISDDARGQSRESGPAEEQGERRKGGGGGGKGKEGMRGKLQEGGMPPEQLRQLRPAGKGGGKAAAPEAAPESGEAADSIDRLFSELARNRGSAGASAGSSAGAAPPPAAPTAAPSPAGAAGAVYTNGAAEAPESGAPTPAAAGAEGASPAGAGLGLGAADGGRPPS